MQKYNWSNIDLQTAIQIIQYERVSEPLYLENEINLLSIITKKSVRDLEDLNPNVLVDMYNDYSFIKDLPIPKVKYVTSLYLKEYGKVRLTPFNELSVAQMVDIEELAKDGIVKNYHKILAVLFNRYKFSFMKMKYVIDDLDTFNTRSEAFLKTDFEQIYSVISFFLSIAKIYMNNLGDSLMEKMPK